MASGGVSAYAAISARVRAMYSRLLSPQDLIRLSDLPDGSNLVNQLKHTAYGSYLDNLKEKDFVPDRIVLQIKGKLADAYGIEYVYRLCSFLPLLGMFTAFLPDIRIPTRE